MTFYVVDEEIPAQMQVSDCYRPATPEDVTDAMVMRFAEGYVWPRYGVLGGPDHDECRDIVLAVIAALSVGEDR